MEINLPIEILIHLFKFLPKSDRKAASETCHAWYSAANAYCFLKHKLVIFHKIDLCDETTTLQIFENSTTPFFNYMFSGVEISNKLNDFWVKMGKSIRCLTFNKCDIHEKEFVFLLEKCENLQVLQIIGCKELFMSGCLLEGKTKGLVTSGLRTLRILSMSGNQYLTDALFYRFVQTASALEELNVSDTSVQFHKGLVRKFYPPSTDVFKKPSESVFTFYFILKFLISRASSIQRLQLSNTLVDGAALISISEIKDLYLNCLQLAGCEQVTISGLKALVNHQKYITDLDISSSSRVTDQSLLLIAENLKELEILNVQRCKAVSDPGVSALGKLKKLKRLNISQCALITKDAFEKGICLERNNVLQDLDINSLNLDTNAIISISEKLPKLRYLNMSYCFNGVTDTSIQVIFKNQVLLRTLKISHCDKVSDAGLTGMGKIDTAIDDESPIMSGYVETNNQNRIGLGSRAEEEIIRDARRKQDVMKMCEKVSLDSFTGYSLARLKGLRELDIGGCNKITDVSLTYAFKLQELYSLNMSKCQQITVEGLNHLVNNCPSIEYINLYDCYNLNDEGLRTIVNGLKRLKQLEVRGCNQLTDLSIKAIREHCCKIQVIDLQGCRNISAEAATTLGSMSTLHTILLSKPGPYITDGVKNRSPAPAFLSSLLRKFRLH